MLYFYGTTAVVSENNLATEVVAILDDELQLTNGPLALSSFALRRIYLLKQGFTNL